MAKHTIKQQIRYWMKLLPTNSVWLTSQLTCKYVTVKGVYYDNNIDCVIVHYAREDAPGNIFQEKAGAFYNYIVDKKVK